MTRTNARVLSMFVIGVSLLILQGCTTYATIQVLAEEEGSKKPIVGEVFMADSSRYLGITPMTFDILQNGYQSKPLPLIFKTECNNLYYKMFAVDKWSNNQRDTVEKFNSYLFSVKPENCHTEN